MLKLQQSEVRNLEILANQGEGGNDHQEKGETIRSGIAKSRTIRSGKNESRNMEARSLGGSPAATSPVAVLYSNSCSVPKCNNDLIICLLLFFQISMFLMLLL